ncbi:unnamed protein product, partial [Ectocarpus fasciculatus]
CDLCTQQVLRWSVEQGARRQAKRSPLAASGGGRFGYSPRFSGVRDLRLPPLPDRETTHAYAEVR